MPSQNQAEDSENTKDSENTQNNVLDLSQTNNQTTADVASKAGERPKTKAQSLHGIQQRRPKPALSSMGPAAKPGGRSTRQPAAEQPNANDQTAQTENTPPDSIDAGELEDQTQTTKAEPLNLRASKPRPKTKKLQQEKTKNRLERAQQTNQSQQVAKFSAAPAAAAADQNTNTSEPLDLRQPAGDISRGAKAMSPETDYPVEKQPALPPQPVTEPAQTKTGQSGNFITNFWGRLTSKLQNRPRLAPTMATAILILVLGGYITYLNLPNLALKVAANQAGFEAQLPKYTPDGYSFRGPITYSTGQIAFNFHSNADESNVQIMERKTSWDSASLKANYVDQQAENPTVFKEKGLTIYFFSQDDQRTFTWVNQGIWYQLEANSHLSPEQLLLMATSM